MCVSIGAYLLSGGEESVLVIWQLNNNGATKKFLPRLGAPLKYISSSPTDELTAICHADNGMFTVFYLWRNYHKDKKKSSSKFNVAVLDICSFQF